MKPMLRGVAVAVAAVGMAACVKQVWQVTYPGPENYSYGAAVVQGQEGLVYMAGRTLDQTFVAAYGSNGAERWQVELPGQGAGLLHKIGREITIDHQGDLYLSWYPIDGSARRLIKLDGKTGTVLLDRALDGVVSLPVTDMRIGPDGNLYFINSWGNGVVAAAYTPQGDLLWLHESSNVENAGDIEPEPVVSLDDYWAGAPLGKPESNAVASQPSQASLWTIQLVFVNGRALVRAGNQLRELDDHGDVVNERSAADLGLSSLQRVETTADGLLVVGSSGLGVATLVYLDQALNVVSSRTLDALASATLLSVRSDGACIAIQPNIAEGGAPLHLARLDASGAITWQTPVAIEGGTWEYTYLQAAPSSCYLTAGIYSDVPSVRTLTRRYDSKGKVSDTVSLADFEPSGVLVEGSSIYHVGITGEYDGSVTDATLVKHQRY